MSLHDHASQAGRKQAWLLQVSYSELMMSFGNIKFPNGIVLSPVQLRKHYLGLFSKRCILPLCHFCSWYATGLGSRVQGNTTLTVICQQMVILQGTNAIGFISLILFFISCSTRYQLVCTYNWTKLKMLCMKYFVKGLKGL